MGTKAFLPATELHLELRSKGSGLPYLARMPAVTAIYNAVQPPSMARIEPVTNSASSEQR